MYIHDGDEERVSLEPPSAVGATKKPSKHRGLSRIRPALSHLVPHPKTFGRAQEVQTAYHQNLHPPYHRRGRDETGAHRACWTRSRSSHEASRRYGTHCKRGGPRNSDRLLRWDPDHREGVWNVPKETELPG